MADLTLPEPVLTLALGPVDKIKQDDQFAVGGLWSVLTKVKGAVADGKRLENITWRLWYRARSSTQVQSLLSLSHGVPICRDLPLRPVLLSSPSVTSSSSEGTNSSSEWDKETAVNDDEELLAHNVASAQRPAVVSPPALKPATLEFARTSVLAPSGTALTHQETIIQDTAIRNQLTTPLVCSPHHSLQVVADAQPGGLRIQGASYSDSKHHSRNPDGSSNAPHLPLAPLAIRPNDRTMAVSPPNTLSHSSLPLPPFPEGKVESLADQIFAPSTDLASKAGPPSVGNLVSFLLSDQVMSSQLAQHVKALKTKQVNKPSVITGTKQHHVAPRIVEPQMSISTTASPQVQPGTSPSNHAHSAVTSATSTPRQPFPTVVVVNPTPHPTPPTTPSDEEPQESRSPSKVNTSAATSATPPINQPQKPPSPHWTDSMNLNGQLGTPVSVNGDANPIGSLGRTKEISQIRSGQSGTSHGGSNVNDESTFLALSGPTAAIILPEKLTDREISSHLPTPATEVSRGLTPASVTAMVSSAAMSTPAPIPAPQPSEEKKFFLAAPQSGSGGSGHWTDSPGSTRMDSFSPSRRDGIHRAAMLASRDAHDRREEDVASSFSAGSPAGGAPSITSSKGGVKFNKRATFTVAGSKAGITKRKGAKKVTLLPRDGHHHKREGSITEEVRLEPSPNGKGKERETGVVPPATTPANFARAKSLQHLPLTAQHLRQLPTVPPPRRAPPGTHSPAPSPPRNGINGASQATTSTAQRNNTQLPYHPQLPLGHLPTVPTRRRPIEITETSSDYSTDTEEDSWESDSNSGEEHRATANGAERDGPAGSPLRPSLSPPQPARVPAVITRNARTRDLNDFARDAVVEAQRQRDMFQKLPARSYSNLTQLPRTKSGLSMIFNPPTDAFPEGHPYKRSGSHHDLLARNWSAPAPPLAMNPLTKRAPVEPVSAQVTVSSVKSNSNIAAMSDGRRNSGAQRNGYRPRIKPPEEEEETETDDDEDDGIQLPASVAERKLAALSARSARQPQPPPQQPTPTAAQHRLPTHQPIQRTATLPVLHAYLPEPAPMQSPNAIRKNIISQELDEDLRRNLLWERSHNQIQGRPPRAPGSILTGPWRPLTTMRPTSETQEQKPADQDPSRRTFATQRTKSWAGDYHAHGW
ncbi:hypothetical protein M422DRAFT_26928 [Sphaerobolus stellatus SS14]|nr:hypothetical protein M422DRAFT_26928 [Sphaerobolus stellatus SS14]